MSGFPADRRVWEVELRPWARGWELWVDGQAVTQTIRGEGESKADPESMMRDWITAVFDRDASGDVLRFHDG